MKLIFPFGSVYSEQGIHNSPVILKAKGICVPVQQQTDHQYMGPASAVFGD